MDTLCFTVAVKSACISLLSEAADNSTISFKQNLLAMKTG
jgi:hypothetical protein